VLGAGLQGRAAILDLERSAIVERIIAADRDIRPVQSFLSKVGARRTEAHAVDAADEDALRRAIGDPAVSLVLDLLPVAFDPVVARVALSARKPVVTTNYAHDLGPLDEAARSAGVVLMPEAGFDPGIDLVMAARAISRFDRVEGLSSYGTGIPAPECRHANAINYKISWSFAGVLRTYARQARLRAAGRNITVAPTEIFSSAWRHSVHVDEVGQLEAFPNGDAVAVADAYGLLPWLNDTARFTLRWPGHGDFWHRIVSLGLLDDRPTADLGTSPREFLQCQLEPQLQYAETERDFAYLRLDVTGTSGSRRHAIRLELADYRDLESGLLAMNRLVGYPASLVAQMILTGEIATPGVCRAATAIPAERFFAELSRRGIRYREREIDPSECYVASRLPAFAGT
jgi:saccharopine dehydrogenase-like NADP-dependent oxidoreductase